MKHGVEEVFYENCTIYKTVSSKSKEAVDGQFFTFFQEIWNLLFTKCAHCRNVSIVSEKREDIVGEYICVCVGAGRCVSYAP